MEIRGPGPYRGQVLEGIPDRPGFPGPVSLTVCPYPLPRPACILSLPRTRSVCGRLPGCKQFFGWVWVMRSGAVVCPASLCGIVSAAGLYGDTRTGSISGPSARRHPGSAWFSRSRLIDRLPLPLASACLHPEPAPDPIRVWTARRAALRRRREPGRFPSWLPAPRGCAPSGWRAPLRPASTSSGCAPSSPPATDRRSCRAGWRSE